MLRDKTIKETETKVGKNPSALERHIAAREYGRKKGETFRRGMKASVRGSEIGLAFIAGALAGNWLDNKFGWAPWGVLTGMLIALAHAIKMMQVIVKDYNIQHAPKDLSTNESTDHQSDKHE